MKPKALLIRLAAVLIVALLPHAAYASNHGDFPSKPITLIVAYGAGGGTDVTARLLAGPLEEVLGVPVVVTNITGGGGWNGWGTLARANPDGYTIGYINVPNMYAGYLDPRLGRRESLESFAAIMNHVTDPGVWVVRSDSPFRTVDDVISYLRQNPGGINMVAHGYGGDDHLGILQIEKRYGVQFSVIHNDSTATSLSQLLGGHVDIVAANVGEVTTRIEEGAMRAIAVAWEERSPFLPDVPTFREQGYDVITFAGRGVAAPAGTPPERLAVIADALRKVIYSPDHLERLRVLGMQPDTKEGIEYQEFLKRNEQMVRELMGW